MSRSKISEALRTVREELSDPARWCKGVALFPPGVPAHDWWRVRPRCLIVAAIDHFVEGIDEFLDDQAESEGLRGVNFPTLRPAAWFNDHPETTHADVLAFLDRAIARAEKEGV